MEARGFCVPSVQEQSLLHLEASDCFGGLMNTVDYSELSFRT